MFKGRVNPESVELLPLEKKEDLDFLHNLLTEFQNETGSTLAQFILDNWEAEQKEFVKVNTTFVARFFFLRRQIQILTVHHLWVREGQHLQVLFLTIILLIMVLQDLVTFIINYRPPFMKLIPILPWSIKKDKHCSRISIGNTPNKIFPLKDFDLQSKLIPESI